jgi:hypothetical protein
MSIIASSRERNMSSLVIALNPQNSQELATIGTVFGRSAHRQSPGKLAFMRVLAVLQGRRHTVTQRLVCSALDCQEAVFAAQSSRGAVRSAALARADAALNALRLYLRLAHRWRWLNDGQYEHVSKMVAEVGRLLGGWIRQSGAA